LSSQFESIVNHFYSHRRPNESTKKSILKIININAFFKEHEEKKKKKKYIRTRVRRVVRTLVFCIVFVFVSYARVRGGSDGKYLIAIAMQRKLDRPSVTLSKKKNTKQMSNVRTNSIVLSSLIGDSESERPVCARVRGSVFF